MEVSSFKVSVYANVIHAKGAPSGNCWGFVDGIVTAVCRQGESQQIVYNVRKRLSGITFPYVVAPNGLIDILDGPYEGKNDSMLADSNLFEKLNNHFHTLHGEPLCIYGDSA